jgi:hypothetical protein
MSIFQVVSYKEKAAHHVHAAADAGVETGLVHRDHPLAAGLLR